MDVAESIMVKGPDREASMQFVGIISPEITVFTDAHRFPFSLFFLAMKKKSIIVHRGELHSVCSCAPVTPYSPNKGTDGGASLSTLWGVVVVVNPPWGCFFH